MHNAFRTRGQQMGMQLIRSILPESIDVFINQAINEKIRNTLTINASTEFKDKVSTENNKVSSVNTLRTLISKYVDVNVTKDDDGYICYPNLNDVFVYTSFKIKYENDNKYYSCRLIDNDKLEETLSDFCNSASYEYPIVTLYSEGSTAGFEIFIGTSDKNIKEFAITYIKNPAIVKWSDDVYESVDCDLPDYLHEEIINIAVNKFIASINIASNKT